MRSGKDTVYLIRTSDKAYSQVRYTPEWADKAGSYAIQGRGALFVKRIEGDYYNVVGLPVSRLSREISAFMQRVARPKIKYKKPSGDGSN